MQSTLTSYKVGDTVRVKGTTHISKVVRVEGKWHELEEKAPQHRYNAYGFWQLVPVVENKEVENG